MIALRLVLITALAEHLSVFSKVMSKKVGSIRVYALAFFLIMLGVAVQGTAVAMSYGVLQTSSSYVNFLLFHTLSRASQGCCDAFVSPSHKLLDQALPSPRN